MIFYPWTRTHLGQSRQAAVLIHLQYESNLICIGGEFSWTAVSQPLSTNPSHILIILIISGVRDGTRWMCPCYSRATLSHLVSQIWSRLCLVTLIVCPTGQSEIKSTNFHVAPPGSVGCSTNSLRMTWLFSLKRSCTFQVFLLTRLSYYGLPKK